MQETFSYLRWARLGVVLLAVFAWRTSAQVSPYYIPPSWTYVNCGPNFNGSYCRDEIVDTNTGAVYADIAAACTGYVNGSTYPLEASSWVVLPGAPNPPCNGFYTIMASSYPTSGTQTDGFWYAAAADTWSDLCDPHFYGQVGCDGNWNARIGGCFNPSC